MNNGKFSESKVVSQLSRKNDLSIQGKRILWNQKESTSKGDVGIRSKGKIDFLCNFCGYTVVKQ